MWRVDCSPVTILETVRVCRMFIFSGLCGLGEVREKKRSLENVQTAQTGSVRKQQTGMVRALYLTVRQGTRLVAGQGQLRQGGARSYRAQPEWFRGYYRAYGVCVGLGVRGLGFAKLVAEFRSVRLILEPFDSGKGRFVTVFVTENCWLVSKGNEGGFKDAVGNRGGCLHVGESS